MAEIVAGECERCHLVRRELRSSQEWRLRKTCAGHHLAVRTQGLRRSFGRSGGTKRDLRLWQAQETNS